MSPEATDRAVPTTAKLGLTFVLGAVLAAGGLAIGVSRTSIRRTASVSPPATPSPPSMATSTPGFHVDIPDVDALDRAMDALAGTGAMVCGSAKPSNQQAIKHLDDCVREALAGHEAFWARYDLQGIDSLVAMGVVRTRSRQVVVLHYDSAPGGNIFDPLHERFSIELCPDAQFVGGEYRLACGPLPISYLPTAAATAAQ